MTHDELREVVARAICCPGGCYFEGKSDRQIALMPYEHTKCTVGRNEREKADAALAAVWEALREPDAGMHEAGFAKSLGPMLGETEMPGDFPSINAAIYRAMLAASPLRPAASAEGVG